MFYFFFFFQIVSQTTVAVDSNSNILSASDLSLETAKLLEHRMKLVKFNRFFVLFLPYV